MNVAYQVYRTLHPIMKLGKFNNIRVRIVPERVWHNEYAIFTAEFDNPIFNEFYNEDFYNEYVELEFNEEKLIDDFRKNLEANLPNCKIVHYPACDEWEIMGPNYKEFHKANLDKLEELAMKDGHHIFEVK